MYYQKSFPRFKKIVIIIKMSDRERHLLRRLPLIKQKWGLHHKGCQKNKVPLRKNKNFKIEKEIIKWIRKHCRTGFQNVNISLVLQKFYAPCDGGLGAGQKEMCQRDSTGDGGTGRGRGRPYSYVKNDMRKF